MQVKRKDTLTKELYFRIQGIRALFPLFRLYKKTAAARYR